jgi:hypothetical protein
VREIAGPQGLWRCPVLIAAVLLVLILALLFVEVRLPEYDE